MKNQVKKLKVKKKKKEEHPKDKRCRAKTSRNTPCMNYALANGRCKYHGGKAGAPKGNKNKLKHGIYGVGLHADEYEIYDSIELGTLDEEIRLARVRLRRCLRAQRWWEEQRNKVHEEIELGELAGEYGKKHLDITSVEERKGTYLNKDGEEKDTWQRKILRSKIDYQKEIRASTNLIKELEKTRKELQEKMADKDFMEKVVGLFRDFSSDAIGTLPGGEV